jgi:5-epi-alpha-selinene synthase
MERFVIPDIFCPFPSQVSPYLEQVRQQAQEWIQEFRLIKGEIALRYYLTADFPLLTCRAHPRAGLEELFLCCNWYTWVFVFDDQFDDGVAGRQPESMRVIYDHMLALLQDPASATPQGPAAESLANIWQRARRLMPSSVWQRRFIQHHADFFAACCRDAENRVNGHMLDLWDYIANRRNGGANPIVCDLIELAGHIQIPDVISENQVFKALLRAAHDSMGWTNDVYGLQKELAHGDTNNLVMVVQQAHNCSLQEAMDRACVMLETEMRRFEQLAQSLPTCSPAEVDRDIRQYLVDVGSWIRGHLEWERMSLRYSEVEYTELGKSSSYLEEILPSVEVGQSHASLIRQR